MRTKKRITDFGAVSRRSIKRDFQMMQLYHHEEKTPEIENLPGINTQKRILYLSQKSEYFKYCKYIVGKLVRLKQKSGIGSNSWYCEFVHDDDRMALNKAAGWSENKKLYLFDGVKFR